MTIEKFETRDRCADWRGRALCAGDGYEARWWDHDAPKKVKEQACAVCRDCPVRRDCGRLGVETATSCGVMAGFDLGDEDERKALRRWLDTGCAPDAWAVLGWRIERGRP